MAYLLSQVINDSLVDLGVLKPGAVPSTTIQTDCFNRACQLWNQWGVDESITNAQYHQALTVTAGTNNYTFGTGGSLTATATPVRVYGAESVSGNFRSPVEVVSFQEFDERARDAMGGNSVLANLLAADNSYPSINLRVFPMPATSPGTLWLDYFGVMTAFTAVTNDLSTLAPQFLNALHFNLAMALLPQYGRQGIDGAAIAANAASSLGAIQSLNRSIMAPPQPQQGSPQ